MLPAIERASAAPAVPVALWAAAHQAAAGEAWPPRSDDTADLFVAQCSREGLLPLLFATPGQPDTVRRALERHRGWQRLADARAAIIARALRDLIRLMDGEPFVVLKGADYMARLYAHPALRPMQDIDILVPSARIDAVCERLLAAGLRRRAPTRAARAAPSYYERAFLHGDVVVEIHQAFLQRSRHPIDYDAVWQRRVPRADLGPHVSRLADADAVAYHGLAMAKDEFSVPLVRHLDLRLLLEAAPGVVPSAAERAREWKATRAFYGALHLLRRVLPDLAGETEPVEKELLRPVTRVFLARCVLPPAREHGQQGAVTRRRQLWRKFWLMDGTRQRLAFAAEHAAAWWAGRRR